MRESYDLEKVGTTLKVILKRMSANSFEPAHICSTCNYRNTETYTEQEWGMERVWHNWCGLNKEYMELEFSDGNGVHFSESCENWESYE